MHNRHPRAFCFIDHCHQLFRSASRFDSYPHVHLRFSSQNSSFNVCGVLSVAAECNFVGPLFAPLGRAVEESLMACSPQNRHRENPSLHKQSLCRGTRHLGKRWWWRNWNLNLGGVGPFLPCLLRCNYYDLFCLLRFLNSRNWRFASLSLFTIIADAPTLCFLPRWDGQCGGFRNLLCGSRLFMLSASNPRPRQLHSQLFGAFSP